MNATYRTALVGLFGFLAGSLVYPTCRGGVVADDPVPTPHAALLAEVSSPPHDTAAASATVLEIIDGDSIRIRMSGKGIRVAGIDAPESDQPYGAEASQALARLILGRTVELRLVDTDRYQREVMTVHLDGRNVSERMVQQGHAWAYRQYARDPALCALEYDARRRAAGLWREATSAPVAPWEWRRRGKLQSFTDHTHDTVDDCVAALGRSANPTPSYAASETDRDDCLIKGNISGNGRIYHMPGAGSYAATRINEAKGERWFCSEEEARAAGWRAPRR